LNQRPGPRTLTWRGKSLRFETLEHGGQHADDMPQAIRVADAEGRSCVCRPIRVDGRVVDSVCFALERKDRAAEPDTASDDPQRTLERIVRQVA
jgi:hypothetical protein